MIGRQWWTEERGKLWVSDGEDSARSGGTWEIWNVVEYMGWDGLDGVVWVGMWCYVGYCSDDTI